MRSFARTANRSYGLSTNRFVAMPETKSTYCNTRSVESLRTGRVSTGKSNQNFQNNFEGAGDLRVKKVNSLCNLHLASEAATRQAVKVDLGAAN